MLTPPEEDRYLRLPELVRYSGLSLRTLKRYMADPDHPLPVHRLGERVALVRKREFDQWLEARANTPTRGPAPISEARAIALARRGHVVAR